MHEWLVFLTETNRICNLTLMLITKRSEYLFKTRCILIRSSFKMFQESLYFWEIQNSTIIEATFLSKYSPCAINYILLPATLQVLETFLKAILWKIFQLFRHIRIAIISITQAPPLQCWFQSREQVKSSWRQVRSEWGMIQRCHIVLC